MAARLKNMYFRSWKYKFVAWGRNLITLLSDYITMSLNLLLDSILL